MADKSHWITFIAEYEDGSKVPFQIDPWTLERGDHVAHTVAREKQEEGFLKPGEIAMVYDGGEAPGLDKDLGRVTEQTRGAERF